MDQAPDRSVTLGRSSEAVIAAEAVRMHRVPHPLLIVPAGAGPVKLGSAGNIRSKTLRAFDSDEMAGIIGRAG